jgi:hypothetical protein
MKKSICKPLIKFKCRLAWRPIGNALPLQELHMSEIDSVVHISHGRNIGHTTMMIAESVILGKDSWRTSAALVLNQTLVG